MNAVRSPMAAAILSHLAGRSIYVESAGVRAGEPDPFAEAVMEEAFRKGLLVLTCGRSTIRFCPPLTLSPEQADEAVGRFALALEACVAR